MGVGGCAARRSLSVLFSLVILLIPQIRFVPSVVIVIVVAVGRGDCFPIDIMVVVVFTLKAVPVSTQYFLTSVLVQLTRTPSVVTG